MAEEGHAYSLLAIRVQSARTTLGPVSSTSFCCPNPLLSESESRLGALTSQTLCSTLIWFQQSRPFFQAYDKPKFVMFCHPACVPSISEDHSSDFSFWHQIQLFQLQYALDMLTPTKCPSKSVMRTAHGPSVSIWVSSKADLQVTLLPRHGLARHLPAGASQATAAADAVTSGTTSPVRDAGEQQPQQQPSQLPGLVSALESIVLQSL